ncbi:MAG: hypothetical protein NT027_05080 [Proteobacteria bacterium]|nr:hypothetical protein [Pseudomonadota bacterium]
MSLIKPTVILILRTQVRKIWWNFEQNFTLLLSAAALVSLFVYILKDFATSELSKFSPEWMALGLRSSFYLGVFCTSLVIARQVRKILDSQDSFQSILYRIGASSRDVAKIRQALAIVGFAVSISFIYFLSLVFKQEPSVLAYLLASICYLISLAVQIRRNESHVKKYSGTIVDWRRHQLLHRSIPGKGLLRLGVAGAIAVPISAIFIKTATLIQLSSLAVGLVTSFGLVQAIAADLPNSWFEKQGGLTHDQWQKSWQVIANTFALTIATICSFSVVWLTDLPPQELWNIPFLAGFLPWLVPSLALQIDGRSQNLNIIVMVLTGLFLGTAMMATPWVAIALPIIKSQASQYQSGRYFRA